MTTTTTSTTTATKCNVSFLVFGLFNFALAWWYFESAPNPTAAQAQSIQSSNNATKAEARFDMDGVTGTIKFKALNVQDPNSHIQIDYELRGLKGNNKLYHVHLKPVPAFKPEDIRGKPGAIGDLCNEPATGGHLNPFNVKEKLKPKSAPMDRYEIGDLSGKHGPMLLHPGTDDLYKGTFVDSTLHLNGPNGIINRSIVIHKSEDGKRWVCASILEVK